MWDTKNSEEYYIDEEVSIKDRLKNPNMKRASDVMAEMSIALGLIMDQLEEMSKENQMGTIFLVKYYLSRYLMMASLYIMPECKYKRDLIALIYELKAQVIKSCNQKENK